MKLPLLLLLIAPAVNGLMAKEEAIRPGSIRADELKEYDALPPGRKKLIDAALKLAAGDQWLTYTYGSSDPANGGLDCSGSMYYLMEQIGIDPPRTSSDQCEWVKSSNRFTEVPATVSSLDDPAFNQLTPGDLLFWSGTTGGDDGTVSHVQMFLGHEKSDDLAVMAGSSDGRSYRGKRRDGYGVFDFKLPVAGSKARFLGYGPPAALRDAGTPVVAKNDPKVKTERKPSAKPSTDEDEDKGPAVKKKRSDTATTAATTTKKKKADASTAETDSKKKDPDAPATTSSKKKKSTAESSGKKKAADASDEDEDKPVKKAPVKKTKKKS